MSAWSEFTFTFETSDGVVYQVEGQTYADGTYDEPMLCLDGEVGLRSLASDQWLEPSEAKLSPQDLKRLESRIDDELDSLTRDHSCDISQDLMERAADQYHDMMEDR